LEFYEWGVDSAEIVTEDLLQCVIDNFGFPKFWGRYLVRVPGISEGLTEDEISFIHSKGVKLLPIFNSFQEAIGYRQGIEAANNAVFYARELGIPNGVPLFANVERFFQIDAEWIHGWTEALLVSGYRSGIYNDPVIGNFNKAFCDAINENEWIIKQNILWSAEPELNSSGPQNPPSYMPEAPYCGGNVWAWQYSRDNIRCPIDMNLAYWVLVNILW